MNFLINKLNCKNYVLVALGPRYKLGIETSFNYNFLCNVFNLCLYDFAFSYDDRNVHVANCFVWNWICGGDRWLSIHAWREKCEVLLQHERYTRYGAVHYCKSKYVEIYGSISRALSCLEEGLPLHNKTWISHDRLVQTHYLRGRNPVNVTHLPDTPVHMYDESYLLRKCGDIEVNPGPTLSTESNSSSKKDNEKNNENDNNDEKHSPDDCENTGIEKNWKNKNITLSGGGFTKPKRKNRNKIIKNINFKRSKKFMNKSQVLLFLKTLNPIKDL